MGLDYGSSCSDRTSLLDIDYLVLCWEQHCSSTSSVIKDMYTPCGRICNVCYFYYFSPVYCVHGVQGTIVLLYLFIKHNGNKQLVCPTECCRLYLPLPQCVEGDITIHFMVP